MSFIDTINEHFKICLMVIHLQTMKIMSKNHFKKVKFKWIVAIVEKTLIWKINKLKIKRKYNLVGLNFKYTK